MSRVRSTVGLGSMLALVMAVAAQEKQVVRERPEAPGGPGRRWAVVIGVNEYLDPAIPALRFGVADAHLVADRLAERAGYDPQRILLLTDDQPRGHLRPLGINLRVQVWNWLLNAAPRDTVLVFFSGHGFLDERGRGFLAPADCRKDNLGLTALWTDDLRDMLRQCKARQKLLVLDCCRAGGERGEVAPLGASSQELGRRSRRPRG